MPVEYISPGGPVLMKSGVAYALPVVKVTLFSDGAATFLQSNTSAFTASSAVTLTGGSVALAGGYIKANADALVTVKRD